MMLFVLAFIPLYPAIAWHLSSLRAALTERLAEHGSAQATLTTNASIVRSALQHVIAQQQRTDIFEVNNKEEAMRVVGEVAEALLQELQTREVEAQLSSPTTTPVRIVETSPEFERDSPYRLLISSITVDLPITVDEKNAEKALKSGAWLIPGTPSPPAGGNTVLSGHRFLFKSGARTLYHLDKVKPGDAIIIEWEGKRYTYEVVEKKVVAPTEVSILNNTEEPMLTIFTCDPPYSTKNRLYVRARLVQ